ncbi:MAG: UDP-N-acetylmuramoyl-L-alanine--D-glutamate ligase, partial [Candidatus Roizmanbacteria bacterium]|nr:UDP-N-acetylmuramoyl-L-alanine--D-glutamate ligase [Candidatus Roizmanbacteria bacterium]
MHYALQPLLKGKRVLQIGLGVQGGGLGLARYIAPQVQSLTISDKKTKEELASSITELAEFPSIQFALGGHPDEVFTNVDLIIIGPSVPWNMPQLVAARKKGIEVTSEIELFFKAVTVPVIGITGTRGKTTTTTMIVNMLISAGKRVAIGGNIAGNSTIEILDKQEDLDYIVLELSSWQLAGLHRIKKSPHIAVFTNFYPDHLNFYSSMDEYWYDKTALFAYQKPEDILIVDESLKARIEKSTYRSALQWVASYQKDLRVPGSHNRSNAALAEAVGRTLGMPDEHIEKMLYEFKGVPYRLQKVATIKDIDVYNDTTSTTPIALITAITAMKEQQYQHIVLIMGG